MSDSISPTAIQHCVDEFLGESGECYNYLDYHFVAESAYCRARAYSDAMDRLSPRCSRETSCRILAGGSPW